MKSLYLNVEKPEKLHDIDASDLKTDTGIPSDQRKDSDTKKD